MIPSLDLLKEALSPIDIEKVATRWTRSDTGPRACFGVQWSALVTARPKVERGLTVVLAGYENPKAVSGGILAVLKRLFPELIATAGPASMSTFIRLSPLHTNLATAPDLATLRVVANCYVRFEGREVPLTVYDFGAGDQAWHLFSAPGFFEADGGIGHTDPYIYSGEDQSARDGDGSHLLRDSLFACKAVPAILVALGKTQNVLVHAQDWQFASAVLTVKEAILAGSLVSAAVVLTLHNAYDHGLSAHNLAKITDRAGDAHWPMINAMTRQTVLTRMIPLMDAPVSVVSHQFALELTEAPIQTGVFTGHQQGVFDEQGLVGIDNGDFGAGAVTPFSSEALRQARNGDVAQILKEKATHRAAMLSALAKYLRELREFAGSPSAPLAFGTLAGEEGRPLEELPAHIPIFMMIGRLDPGQKGYDVCANAVRSLPRNIARFVLTPMSPLANDAAVKPFVAQLQELCQERPGEIVVLAHRMTTAYIESMRGATFALWPSRYEPFGGASEFYRVGTPVVAHAAGGLIQQVIGYDQSPAMATGLLYSSSLRGELRATMKRWYRQTHESGPDARMSVPVYRQECDSLQSAIVQAVDIFQDRPEVYGQMLANLPTMLDTLKWDKPAKDYLAWYEMACR